LHMSNMIVNKWNKVVTKIVWKPPQKTSLVHFLCRVSAKPTVKSRNIATKSINRVVGTKAINLTECGMVSENFTTKMVGIMKVNGNRIRWMVSLNFTTRMVR
jgi:hypothetical protein